MSAPPGSLRWLVGQQLRWQWRGLTGGQRRGVWAALLLGLALTTGLFFLLRPALRGASLGGPLPTLLYAPVLFGQALLLTLMVSAAVTSALRLLFERGDLDLLLQSPVAPGTVLAARALNVAINAALSVALVLAPLIFALLIAGAWRGLGVLLWWGGAAFLATSLGLWLTLGLVRWLGVRRTRTVSSVTGALFGGALFLLSQWPNFSRSSSEAAFGRVAEIAPGVGNWPGASQPLWYPVQAAWLAPLPTLAWLAGAGPVFALTVLALTRRFTEGTQEAAEGGGRRPARPTAQALRFASGARATLLKEWRLIGRDPELLSRTLLQLVYLIPLAFSVGRLSLAGTVGAGVVMLTGSLTYNLARLTLDAEDAPDLLLCAPRSPAALRREKWLAAALPPLCLGLLALLTLALRGALDAAFLGGALLWPLLLLSAGGAALLVLWQPLPLRRADAFRQGQHPVPLLNRALSLVFQVGLSAASFGAGTGRAWALLPLALGLGALLIAFNSRKSDVQ